MIKGILNQKRIGIMKNIIQIGEIMITLEKKEKVKMMKNLENLKKIPIFRIIIKF